MRSTCKKAKYRSEEFALADIKKFESKKDGRRKPVRAYLCPLCGHWHLTSKFDYKEGYFALLREIKELRNNNLGLNKKVKSLMVENSKLKEEKK